MTTPPALAAPAVATAAAGLPRLLPSPGHPGTDLAAHLATFGRPTYREQPLVLVRTLEAAGLTGRGGAAFVTWRKLSAAGQGGGQPVVVGNRAEGEPASHKDKTLLRLSPHLVLDGLQLAAEAIDAAMRYLYVHHDTQLRNGWQQSWLNAPAPGARPPRRTDRIPARSPRRPPGEPSPDPPVPFGSPW